MTTTSELTITLASALGLPRRLAEETARHLQEARMLPAPKDPAGIEDGVTLLLGLMAAPTPADAPNCARLYRQLPLDCVTRYEVTDSHTEVVEIADPAPFLAMIRDGGETFGRFLETLIKAVIESGSSVEPASLDPRPAAEPGKILVGGGPGTATGSVGLVIDNPAHPFVVGFVNFTLAPLGGGRNPDDAPVARLDCYAQVPESIFKVFREFFTGRSEGPQKQLPSRAVPTHQAGSGGHAAVGTRAQGK